MVNETGLAQIRDFELTIRVRNNRIKARRRALGLSQPALAALAGVTLGTLNAYETLRESPFGKKGWRPSARRLAEYFRLLPEDLWPDVVLAVKKAHATVTMDANDLATFGSGKLGALPSDTPSQEAVLISAEEHSRLMRAFDALPPMHARILRWRFGLDEEPELTLQEIGDKYNLSRERIRSLEVQAICKLRSVLRGDDVSEKVAHAVQVVSDRALGSMPAVIYPGDAAIDAAILRALTEQPW